jgi:hypothetical protein
MGALFERYFALMAGKTPGTEYGVIASPTDGSDPNVVGGKPPVPECVCRAA